MQYQTEHNARGGFRFNMQNLPAVGTKFRNPFGETVVFDEICIAGMLVCTGPSGQSLYMPHALTELEDSTGEESDE